jgi:hypothetical protein
MHNKAPAKAQRQVPLRDQYTTSGASNALWLSLVLPPHF